MAVVSIGVAIPRRVAARNKWLARLGAPLIIKLSVNHHLLDHDHGLLALAAGLRDRIAMLGGERELVLNVRLRPDAPDGNARILEAVVSAGLLDIANVFHLQGYGFASNSSWEKPFAVATHFTLVNPDGSAHGTDLIARSEVMRALP